MIEKMKKITLITTERDRENFISGLRASGVIHIKNVEEPSSHEVTFVEDRIAKVERMLFELKPFAGDKPENDAFARNEKDLLLEAAKVSELLDDRAEMFSEKRRIENTLKWFDEWGEVDPADVKLLSERGVCVELFRMNEKLFKDFPKDKEIKVLKKEKGLVFFFTLSPAGCEPDPDAVELPEKSKAEFAEEIKDLDVGIRTIEEELREKASYLEIIKEFEDKLKRELVFLQVKHGMGSEEKFAYLQGFCPVKKVPEVIALADSHGAGYLAEEPAEEEEVPTLITNPKWVRIIDPVFDFMNTLPGYREFDISFIFLIFFSLFFAMLIGDAGYGIVFVLVTFLARRKLPKAPGEPFFLMYLLGGATIVWGAITGTWFGAEGIAKLPVFSSLVIPKINSFSSESQNVIIYMCFLIGAIQLTIAHLMKAVRMINSPRMISDLGWAGIIWGMFFAAGTFVLDKPFPPFAGIALAAGIIAVLIFENFQKNIIKGMMETLMNLPLSVIGSFSDVVSYLRLFAVGYASVVLASTFNNMAIGDGISSVAGGIMAALILFLGHTLNIVLGMMAVIVHGIRLNMLEFSGHLDMQWSGKKYEPFKE